MNKEDILCPGETIKELLETYHYTQEDLANKLNMNLKTVNEILNGKAPITVETAIKLEMIFGIDASFWNNLEFNYRRDLKEVEKLELYENEYAEIKDVYREMVKRNLIEDTKDKYKRVENFKKFMEVISIESLYQEYNKIACRKTEIKGFNMINLMVWIQIGLRKAREENLKEYNEKMLISKLEDIRKLTLLKNQSEARIKLKRICAECGIIVNFEKSMPNTAIYGIAKWLNSKTPFIQISDRKKNVATFWFTFMHELGHIVNGRKKITFLDMENNDIQDEDKWILKEVEEIRANNFSRNTLIPEKKYNEFLLKINDKKISKQDIIEFAEFVGIAPCIVAGRISYDKEKYDDIILNSFNIKMEF